MALGEAAAGNRRALADLLGEDVESEVVRKAARARVVLDIEGVGALLARADRQLMALLPSARSTADAKEQAQSAVDALARVLLERAGRPDENDRQLSRSEICEVLGIPLSATAVLPWESDVRRRYLAGAPIGGPGAVPARLEAVDRSGSTADLGVEVLLDGVGPVIVAGPTGSGKSTAAGELMAVAAQQGRAVVVANAESYLPGRVDALIADAVSDVLGYQAPTLTGRQVLADSSAVIVIDGVSEIPRESQEALSEDMRAHTASGRGARLILLGRALGALRSVLPASASPALYVMRLFSYERRVELALALLSERSDWEVQVVLARAQEALGDAAGNPMLLSMAIQLIVSGTRFDDRAAVYEASIDRLAAKSGAQGLSVGSVILGVCFAQLLDTGRRYADPYTWRRLLAAATVSQSALIGHIDLASVDEAARRSGLIVSLGHAETVKAIHDSFADYLAGLALARGAIAFPSEVAPGDEERLLFAAQIGGMDRTFAEAIATSLPFSLPRFAGFDLRGLGEDAPEEITAMMRAILPSDTTAGADLWKAPDGRIVAFLREGAGRWLADDAAHEALRNGAWVTGSGGPVDMAVRLWRQWLHARLQATGWAGQPHPRTDAEARESVMAHVAAVSDEMDRLIRVTISARHRARLVEEIGPMGVTAVLSRCMDRAIPGRPNWNLAYTRTDGIDVKLENVDICGAESSTNASLDSLIGTSPSMDAVKKIRAAIDRMAGGRWL